MVQLVQIKTLRETALAKTNVRTICKKRIIFQAEKRKRPDPKNLHTQKHLFADNFSSIFYGTTENNILTLFLLN